MAGITLKSSAAKRVRAEGLIGRLAYRPQPERSLTLPSRPHQSACVIGDAVLERAPLGESAVGVDCSGAGTCFSTPAVPAPLLSLSRRVSRLSNRSPL